jgi:hypothetical protein
MFTAMLKRSALNYVNTYADVYRGSCRSWRADRVTGLLAGTRFAGRCVGRGRATAVNSCGSGFFGVRGATRTRLDGPEAPSARLCRFSATPLAGMPLFVPCGRFCGSEVLCFCVPAALASARAALSVGRSPKLSGRALGASPVVRSPVVPHFCLNLRLASGALFSQYGNAGGVSD